MGIEDGECSINSNLKGNPYVENEVKWNEINYQNSIIKKDMKNENWKFNQLLLIINMKS